MITIENMSKTFDGLNYVFRSISLKINSGEYVQISGKSGSGKSTLLNTIGLLDNDYSGNLFIDGINVSNLTDGKISRIRSEKIGFIFQAYNLIQYMSVEENILMPLVYSRESYTREKRRYIDGLMEQLAIRNLGDKPIQYLSGGEKQRVAIARALCLSPEIILADEPTGNLDLENSNIVFNTLERLHSGGKTIILVTHNYRENIKTDRLIEIKQGRII